MIDDLRQNINTEIEILREISNYMRRMAYASPSEKKLLSVAVESLRSSARAINNSIPSLLDEITIAKKLPRPETKNLQLERVSFKRLDSRIHVVLNVDDRNRFFKDLSITEDSLRKIKKRQFSGKEKIEEIRAPRLYLKFSNRLFLRSAVNLINKGYFKSLSVALRKANIEILLSSYVALILFSTFIAFFLSLGIMVFMTFFKFNLDSVFYFSFFEGNYLLRFFQMLWIPVALPILTFAGVYYYPSSERDSLARKVDQELPFAVIHMSAISGSGIEPTEIFKIIGMSSEYPFLRREIRKVLNQINLYGYDLVTALKNVSKTTSSSRLSELLSGLGVTITSGGDLSIFFEKRAESLLMIYRLDREKYTRSAETFMDIYISLVIAAPMILMVLMVMLQVSNFGGGLSNWVIVLIVCIINIGFLVMLDLKQPDY
jgi:flagellar protein FlaJ